MTGPRPFALAALLALASGCSDDGGTTSSGGTGSTTGPTSSSAALAVRFAAGSLTVTVASRVARAAAVGASAVDR